MTYTAYIYPEIQILTGTGKMLHILPVATHIHILIIISIINIIISYKVEYSIH